MLAWMNQDHDYIAYAALPLGGDPVGDMVAEMERFEALPSGNLDQMLGFVALAPSRTASQRPSPPLPLYPHPSPFLRGDIFPSTLPPIQELAEELVGYPLKS